MALSSETKWMLRALIALAKRNLADSNAARENKRDWPCGQSWDELGHTGQHTFMRAARKEAGIPHDEYREMIEAVMSNGQIGELDAIWAEMDTP